MSESYWTLDDRARWFAEGAHAGQMYGNGNRYSFHLSCAVEVIKRYRDLNGDMDLIAAAWLHDTIEDTKVTYADIATLFGVGVAKLVEAVTDKPGKNRRERHEATYPFIRKNGGYKAVLLKLSDRIANIEYSIDQGNAGKLSMYRKEHEDFEVMVRGPEAVTEVEVAMWNHLKELLKR